MKKILILVLCFVFVLSLCACGSLKKNEEKIPTESTKETVDIDAILDEIEKIVPNTQQSELGENECVNRYDIKFSNLVTINGKEMQFPCDFDALIEHLDASYLYSSEYQEFTQEKIEDTFTLECSVEKGGSRFNFYIILGYDENDKVVANGIVFDNYLSDIRDLGFEITYMGMDINTVTVDEVNSKFQESVSNFNDGEAYYLFLTSYYTEDSVRFNFADDGSGKYTVSHFSVRVKQ